MSNSVKALEKIYENMLKQKSLASRVEDTLDWLLPIEDFEDAEDSCNAEMEQIGMGRESVAYEVDGIVLKINSSENKEDWEKYIQVECFARTELLDANFGFVILQEKLRLDSESYLNDDVEAKIKDCLKRNNLPYAEEEINNENVGLNDKGEWKLFDIPI